MVAETLKLLMVAMLLAAKQGRSAEDGLMAIVLPMLIETASPAGQPNAALVDAAVKLIMHLAAGPSAAAFKVAVGALSVEGKRRLQVRQIGRFTDRLSLSRLCCKRVPGQMMLAPHPALADCRRL